MKNINWTQEKAFIDQMLTLRSTVYEYTPATVESQHNDCCESGRELQRIYNPRGWRLLKRLYHIKDTLLPQSSLRYRIARKIFRGIRFVKRVFNSLNQHTFRKFIYARRVGGLIYALKSTLKYTRRVYAPQVDVFKTEVNITIPKPPHPILFFPGANPVVSVIIPVYNQWEFTYACLHSIVSCSEYTSYEIIIADDGSTDETSRLNNIVKNVQHIVNPSNLGFLLNCNNAARYARGKYLLFLNNDTQVKSGWLDSMVDLMESNETIGLVGSKFLYPDGTIQEAGSIMFNDATSINYGRGNDPGLADYNYVREIDWITGASILLRKTIWDALGGFDTRYAPAYFEDIDLVFAVRKLGYKAMYQPLSEVIHFQTQSYGDGSANERRCELNEKNKNKFLLKWEAELKNQFPPGADFFHAIDRGYNKKTILYIDDMVPFYDQHAGAKTTRHYLKLLSDLEFRMIFVGDNDYHKHEPYTTALQQMGVRVLYGQYYMENFRNWVIEHKDYLDYIFINRPHIGDKYISFFKRELPNSKIVFYGHDLHFLREQREYELTRNPDKLKQSKNSKKIELHIMNKADVVLTVSPNEKEIIDRELNASKAVHTPIFFYANFSDPKVDLVKKRDIMFCGGFGHTPNADGVLWFIREVWPEIKSYLPDVKFFIAGSNPTPEILQCASDDIFVLGYLSVEELQALYYRSRVTVIPLRFGAGVKGKTVEALYNRMAIVSTSIGLEGLPGIGSYLQPYNTPGEFAMEVIRLYQDGNAISQSYDQNYRYVERQFSYDTALACFENIFGRGIRL